MDSEFYRFFLKMMANCSPNTEGEGEKWEMKRKKLEKEKKKREENKGNDDETEPEEGGKRMIERKEGHEFAEEVGEGADKYNENVHVQESKIIIYRNLWSPHAQLFAGFHGFLIVFNRVHATL